MRAQLKRLHSPDADLENFRPVNEEDFSIFVQAMIGHEGSPAEESFGFIVCTPRWLEQQYSGTGKPIIGTGHIVVNAFRYDEIAATIAALCNSITGESWNELAVQLGRFGEWEFANYRPATQAGTVSDQRIKGDGGN